MVENFRLRSVAAAAYGPAALFGLSEGAVLPVIAPSAIERGAGTATAALIAAMLGVGSLVANIPAGVLTTRIGERRSMLVAAAVLAGGVLICRVDLGRGPWSLLLYGSGVVLIGAAAAVYGLARQSYLTEVAPPHMRARALSTLGGSTRIGVFLGPFAGAAAMRFAGLPGAYYVSLAAIAAAAALVLRVPDLEGAGSAHAPVVTTRAMLKRQWRVYATLGLGVLLLSAIRQTRQTVVPLWAAHIGLSPTTGSIIYGVAGAVDALTFYPAGKVMDRYGRHWVAVPATLVLGTSFLLMPLAGGATLLTVAAMVMASATGSARAS
ncbi:MFS transporter [Amycolatopsis sp. cg9]|uniref:MFS transporter n=1 Tax=Amycolatopsis sp. cg9 TaxID=3238801 RepID=UPI003524A2CB